jgi:hypothetical protein
MIASVVKTSVHAAIAARPDPPRGNGDDAAALLLSNETDAAPDPNAAQISAVRAAPRRFRFAEVLQGTSNVPTRPTM